MKSSPGHLTFERLADLAEGRLTAAETTSARAHLEGCAACAGQAAELERLTGLMRADTSEDAPRDLIFNAVQMFRARPFEAETPGLLRRLVASLSFDSGARNPAFGLRSGATAAASRQLLFSAGDTDVDLRLAPSGEGWSVSGQVLGVCAAGRVELFAGGEAPAASADLNDLCEFTLPTVAAGTYTLRLTLGDAEIEVPGLSLQD